MGSLGMGLLSLKRLCGGGLRGSFFIGDPGIILRKSPDTDISLHGGPVSSEGNLVFGGGGSYTGDFDRLMKEGSSGGASLCEGFHQGGLEGGLLYWGTRKMRFLREMQNAL